MFGWEDYLALATYLGNNANNQGSLKDAMLRTAISRAYYSAFNFAKFYLTSNGHSFVKSADVHKQVQSIFHGLSIIEAD